MKFLHSGQVSFCCSLKKSNLVAFSASFQSQRESQNIV